jgi:FtsH-binding integral membrane protein
METQTIHSDEKLVEAQTLERRAQFALGLSTVITVVVILMAIGSVGLWLFFRQYAQLLALVGVCLVLLIGSASFPTLHRQGRTTLGFYLIIITFFIVVSATTVIFPNILPAIGIGLIIVVTMAVLLLGDQQSRWFIGASTLALVAGGILAQTVAADWFPPLEKTIGIVVGVSFSGIALLAGALIVRMIVLGQDEQFTKAQLANLEVEKRADNEREQRERLQG